VIENFLLGLEEEGLVTSWVWYFVDEQVRRILGIPASVKVEGIFPIGKKTKISEKDKRNVKLDNILYFGKYGEVKMVGDIKHSRDSV
jgi:nitroreductase